MRFPDLLHLLHTEQEEVVLASLVSMPLILTLPRQVERLHPALIQWDQQLGTRISCSQRKTCCHHLLPRRRMLRARHRSPSWSSSVSSSQTANPRSLRGSTTQSSNRPACPTDVHPHSARKRPSGSQIQSRGYLFCGVIFFSVVRLFELTKNHRFQKNSQ